jgi:hypothetical protein
MPNSVSDIMIAPANIWYSATGVALPDETTVAFGASWGASWTSIGYTLTPLAISLEVETFDLEVQQIPNVVKQVKVKESMMFETSLAELTAVNLKLALGSTSTITTSAAGASQHAFEDLKAGGEVLIPEYQWGFEGYILDSSNHQLPVRMFIYRGTSVLNGALEFSKNAAAGIPLQITALADTTKTAGQQLVQFQRVTGWKTS